jgi:hypothetical protein
LTYANLSQAELNEQLFSIRNCGNGEWLLFINVLHFIGMFCCDSLQSLLPNPMWSSLMRYHLSCCGIRSWWKTALSWKPTVGASIAQWFGPSQPICWSFVNFGSHIVTWYSAAILTAWNWLGSQVVESLYSCDIWYFTFYWRPRNSAMMFKRRYPPRSTWLTLGLPSWTATMYCTT